MDKRCYICGVVGLPKGIVSCMKCRSRFIHVYCMTTVRVTVPNDWVCEDCRKNPKHGCSKFTDYVHVPKRPIKVIPTDEAIALASQSSMSKEKAFTPPQKRVKNLSSMVPGATLTTRSDLRVCNQEQIRYTKQSAHAHIPSQVPQHSLKQKSRIKNPVHARTTSTSKSYPILQNFKELFMPSHTTSVKSGYGTAQGGEDTLKASKHVKLPDEKLTVDRHLPNHPASDATWKGRFRTSGFSAQVRSCDNVWGYQVGRKAYEFSKEMPDVLHLEVIPRRTVWGNMFNEGGPDENDIGLYFVPDGEKSEQSYSCLVSHLDRHDMILKTCISGTDLLIFTSSHLDDKSKKEINKGYYLWGLFVPPSKEPHQNQSPSKRFSS